MMELDVWSLRGAPIMEYPAIDCAIDDNYHTREYELNISR